MEDKQKIVRRFLMTRLFICSILSFLFLANTIPAEAKSSEISEVFNFINKKVGKDKAKKYSQIIVKLSTKNKIPALLTAKVIYRESRFNPNCVTGYCIGLMQVDYRLWFKKGENPYNPYDNINAGTRLLYNLKRRFDNWPAALTAYNFGENHRVTRNLGTSRYAFLVLQGL
jgi:soluble lytic murein transglycosylase-like protein